MCIHIYTHTHTRSHTMSSHLTGRRVQRGPSVFRRGLKPIIKTIERLLNNTDNYYSAVVILRAWDVELWGIRVHVCVCLSLSL